MNKSDTSELTQYMTALDGFQQRFDTDRAHFSAIRQLPADYINR